MKEGDGSLGFIGVEMDEPVPGLKQEFEVAEDVLGRHGVFRFSARRNRKGWTGRFVGGRLGDGVDRGHPPPPGFSNNDYCLDRTKTMTDTANLIIYEKPT